MIRTIFFDFDGVLTTDPSGSITLSRAFAKVSPGMDQEACTLFLHEHALELDTGLKNLTDLLPTLCAACGCVIDPDTLPHIFAEVPWNEPMFALAHALKERYRVGIITDNFTERIECLKNTRDLNSLFSPIIVSADVGSTKSSAAIFQSALKTVDCRPDECVFIDNCERNLSVPSSMGFHTYLFDPVVNDVEALRMQLRAWGVAMR